MLLQAFARKKAFHLREMAALKPPPQSSPGPPVGSRRSKSLSRTRTTLELPAESAPPGLQPPSPSNDGAAADSVEVFVARWEVDDLSAATLRSLPGNVLSQVIAEFNPPSNTRNISRRLHAFVRSRMLTTRHCQQRDQHREVSDDAIRVFASRWSLDQGATDMLYQLPEDVCEDILMNFTPAEDTRNVNARLRSFVKSKLGSYVSPDPISRFVSLHCLDAHSEKLLRGLWPEHVHRVLSEFKPAVGSTNTNKKLASFVRRKLCGERTCDAVPHIGASHHDC